MSLELCYPRLLASCVGSEFMEDLEASDSALRGSVGARAWNHPRVIRTFFSWFACKCFCIVAAEKGSFVCIVCTVVDAYNESILEADHSSCAPIIYCIVAIENGFWRFVQIKWVVSNGRKTILQYLPFNSNMDNPNSQVFPSPINGNHTPVSHVLTHVPNSKFVYSFEFNSKEFCLVTIFRIKRETYTCRREDQYFLRQCFEFTVF